MSIEDTDEQIVPHKSQETQNSKVSEATRASEEAWVEKMGTASNPCGMVGPLPIFFPTQPGSWLFTSSGKTEGVLSRGLPDPRTPGTEWGMGFYAGN